MIDSTITRDRKEGVEMKLRKNLCLLLGMLMMISAFGGFLSAAAEEDPKAPLADFTHTVFVEELTGSWCQYCPSAANTLNSIYDSQDYPFYFIALIEDKVQKANDRCTDDYNVGGYPTVHFDGGYESVVGGQSDESNYRDAIESCGNRVVPDLTVEVTATDLGSATLEISVKITNMGNEEYGGHLRTYISEIVSRYIMYDGNPYHYGFLDYAFDEDILIPAQEVWEDIVTWVGADHSDLAGDDFGDINPNNIMVMAAVFNEDPNPKVQPDVFFAYYSDEMAATLVTPPPVYGVEISPVSQSHTISAGEMTTYILTVTNTGNVEDVFSLSKFGSSSSWGTLSTNSLTLGPGGSDNVLLDVTVPAGTSDGSYDIFVTATSQGDPQETFTAQTTTVVENPPFYDVVLSAPVQNIGVHPGETAEYTISVQNNGNTADTIDLTKSGAYSDWGSLSHDYVVLDFGATQDITLTVDVPSDAQEGDYPIDVRGTSQGNSSKYSEITLTTNVIPRIYDVNLYCDITSQTARPGEQLVYMITVHNNGNVEDTIDLSLSGPYSSWGTLSTNSVTLVPGYTEDFTLTVDIPSDAQGGDYPIDVKGTSQGDPSQTDEISCISTVEPYIYEVILYADHTQHTVRPGQSVDYMITVENAGNTEDTIEMTLSGTYSSWGSLDQYSVFLYPNDTQDIWLTVEIPSDAEGGDYVIKVTGTSCGDPFEDYDMDFTTTVEPWVYDVNLSSDIYEKSARPGENLIFNITVENLGDIEDTIDLSMSGEKSQWGTLSEESVTLGISDSVTITLTMNVPSDAQGGDYEIEVCGTSQGDLSEYSEIQLITTVVPYVYDVHLSSDDPNKSAKPGQTMVFNITCENRGDIEDTVNITISEEIMEWCTLADDCFVLGPGEFNTTTVEVDVPTDAQGGDFYFYVTGSSMGDPAKYHQIRIIATVNPWVYALDFTSYETAKSAFAGESVTYKMTVENIGELNDTFSLSLSGSYKDWGKLFPTSVSLVPYSSEEVSLTVDVPDDVSGGDYKIKVKARSQKDTSEFAELVFTTTVIPFVFDYDLTPENQYSDVALGANAVFEILAENTGNYQETINLELSGAKAEWGYLDPANITLSSGAFEFVYLMIYVPLDSQPGNYYFTVKGTIVEDPYISDSVRVKVIVPEPEDDPSKPKITIYDVHHEPDIPNAEEAITVFATVSGEDIRHVKLQFFMERVLFDNVSMQSLEEDIYSVSVGPLEPGVYEYTIYVEDRLGNPYESDRAIVIVVEPPFEDSDGDGIYDDVDAFPKDDTQWSDADGDGFGDNPKGNNPDEYPLDSSKWRKEDSSEGISWIYFLYITIIICVMVVLIVIRITLKNQGRMGR